MADKIALMNYSQSKQKYINHQLLKWSLVVFLLTPTVFLWLVIGSSLFSYCLVSLQGTSMEPALRHGDALWTKRVDPAELKIGDIVILRHPSLGWITHRVINIQPSRNGYLLETKGDANRIVERSEIEVNGTVRVSLMRIRYAGYVLEFLGSIGERVLLIGVPFTVVAVLMYRKRFSSDRAGRLQ